MILADTDVLIDFLHATGAASRVELEIERGRLLTTVISRFELIAGAAGRRQQTLVQELLSVVPAIPLDEEAADRGATLARDLAGMGSSIGMADCLIAGIAICRKLPLLTRNRKHFEKVPGLSLADIG